MGTKQRLANKVRKMAQESKVKRKGIMTKYQMVTEPGELPCFLYSYRVCVIVSQ